METVTAMSLYDTKILRSRENARKVLSSAKSKTILIDFRNIDFISKSFAHELVTYAKKKRIKIEFKNINNAIKSMINIAELKPKVEFKSQESIKFS